MKKIFFYLIFFIAIAFLVSVVYYFYPKDIILNAEGTKYRLGFESVDLDQSINIHINGKMYRDIRGNRSFKGTIELEGEEIPVPENQRQLEINFNKEYSGMMVYSYFEDAMPMSFPIGTIYINRDFSEITIAVLDKNGDQGSWSAEIGLMITAPAINRTEAIRISNELMKEPLNGYKLE